MGFLNKAFRKIKEQKQTGQMPRRGGGFSSRLRGRKPGMIGATCVLEARCQEAAALEI
jgi:hypothetical protein